MAEVLSLNSNILSLRVQRSLGDSTARLSTSFERLSSGQRINHASDDAAGLAVADRLRVQARISNGALRNISDGISTLNIIDSALQSQNSIIGRLQELATQSANGSLSNNQRSTLNTEYQTLMQEFGRIGSTTQFNNINLLLGGHGTNQSQLLIQAGISGDTNSTIGFSLSDTGKLSGKVGFVNGLGTVDLTGTVYSSFDQVFNTFNNSVIRSSFVDSNGVTHQALITTQATSFFGTGNLNVEVLVRGSDTNGSASSDPNAWVVVANGATNFNPSTGKADSTPLSMTFGALQGGATGTIGLDCSGLQMVLSSSSATISAIDLTGVETSAVALAALGVLQSRRDELSSFIGSIGAVQSRLKSASAVLAATKENTLAAESRIRDVDVAEESANLVASQIRQQTATRILGLANSQPQVVLSLLKNVGQ